MELEKFVWDMTYACPLRCTHCYSESGRRPAKTPSRAQVLALAEVLATSGARRVSLSGGEPLLVPGWAEAARRLRDAGLAVTLFTSGWTLEQEHLDALASSVDGVGLSIDGAEPSTHDRVRGRAGSFQRARAALGKLAAFKRAQKEAGAPCFSLGLEYTVVRSNVAEVGAFVERFTEDFPGVDTLRVGMAIPEGPAADEPFAEEELLTQEGMLALLAEAPSLRARARNGVEVSVTDMRYYVPYSPYGGPGRAIAHLEPDGQLRAFGVYEAKVGNVLEEPLERVWARALAWREDPFVVEQVASIVSPQDWARAARALDARYGSPEDLHRIQLRRAR